MDKEELLKYLNQVFDAEIMIHEQSRIKEYINKEIRGYEADIKEVQKTPLIEHKDEWSIKKPKMPTVFWLIMLVNIHVTLISLLECLIEQRLSIVLIISIIVWIVQFVVKRKITKEDIEAQKWEIERHNEYADEKNEKTKATIERQTRAYSEKLSKARQLYTKNEMSIKETRESLAELYDLNIVYPKYRKLSAIAMFIEYLSSGRCSELEGAYGAYNVFEEEVKSRIIIAKLDEIGSRLDSIRENQRFMYDAIYDSNKKTEYIMHDMKRNLLNIENNTATSQYYEEITAKNTAMLTMAEGYRIMNNK